MPWAPHGTTPRPYQVADLARALGIPITDTAALSRRLDIGRRWIRRYRTAGLTARQSETWAHRAHLHPDNIWPHWEEPDPDLDWYTDDPPLDQLDDRSLSA